MKPPALSSLTLAPALAGIVIGVYLALTPPNHHAIILALYALAIATLIFAENRSKLSRLPFSSEAEVFRVITRFAGAFVLSIFVTASLLVPAVVSLLGLGDPLPLLEVLLFLFAGIVMLWFAVTLGALQDPDSINLPSPRTVTSARHRVVLSLGILLLGWLAGGSLFLFLSMVALFIGLRQSHVPNRPHQPPNQAAG